jgi:FkbM family methyltransferase
MNTLFRHFLPFGFVRASQLHRQMKTLGIASTIARFAAIKPSTSAQLQKLNLNLFPPGALTDLECIVDVGANVGNWAAGVHLFCQPRSLICIEPTPELAEKLRQRFIGKPEIVVVEAAAGREQGSAVLNLMAESETNSLRQPTSEVAAGYPGVYIPKGSTPVKINTLDEILKDHPRIDILKIDAQGSEREVLSGASLSLQRTSYLLIEINFQCNYQGEAGFAELDLILSKQGFSICNYSPPHGGKRVAQYAEFLYIKNPGLSAPEIKDDKYA